MEQEEHIEQYLKGNLSPAEQKAFEETLAADPSLQKTVAEHRAIMLGIKAHFQDQTLNHFQGLEQQAIQQKKKKTSLIQWGSLLAAASVLLFLWLNNPFQEPSNTTLYADYYSTYPNYVDNIKRTDPAVQTAYQTAFFAYEQKNYTQAIQGFEAINALRDPVLEFYWGLSLLELEQYQEALIHFVLATSAPNHRYLDNAIWYQGLTHLQLKEYTRAKVVFQQLIINKSTYKAKAAAILEELDALKY